MFDLSIVIVNWNTLRLLEACLDSIFGNMFDLSVEVIVIDNASTDGSPDMVRERFPQVNLVANQTNIGFARANNQAFPLCNSNLIMLLNSDTRIIGDAMQVLVGYMRTNPKAGASAPKVIVPNERLRVLSAGYLPSIRTVFNQYFFISNIFPFWRAARGVNLIAGYHDDQPRAVEWLSGACMVVRREVIAQVGSLSEQWFMYAEDMEWCQRIGSAGWEIIHLPAAKIEHYLGASAEKNKAVSTMWVSSMVEFYGYHRPYIKKVMFGIILSAGLWLRVVVYSLRSLAGSSQMWRSEGRKFMKYARTAWKSGWGIS